LTLDDFSYTVVSAFNNYFKTIPTDDPSLMVNEFKSFIIFIGDKLTREYLIITGRTNIERMCVMGTSYNFSESDMVYISEFIKKAFILLPGKPITSPIVGSDEDAETTLEEDASDLTDNLFSDENCLTKEVINTIERIINEKGSDGLIEYLKNISKNSD
jgi:hypothetical protein